MKFDETLLYQMTLLILSLPMKLAFTYIPYFTKSSGTDMFYIVRLKCIREHRKRVNHYRKLNEFTCDYPFE